MCAPAPPPSPQVKALLRRATARDALQKYDEAERDLKLVLNLEVNNKQAREDLQVTGGRRGVGGGGGRGSTAVVVMGLGPGAWGLGPGAWGLGPGV